MEKTETIKLYDWYQAKTIAIPELSLPPSLHSKLGCLLFSIGSPNSGTTLRGGDGRGKVLFSPLEGSKV